MIVESNLATNYIFYFYIVLFKHFCCLFVGILLFIHLSRVLKKSEIADGSPLSVDAPASSSPTLHNKQITKIFDIFAKSRILRSFD